MPHPFAGFCVVSAMALSTWISQGGLGGGIGGDNAGTSITLDRHRCRLHPLLLMRITARAIIFTVIALLSIPSVGFRSRITSVSSLASRHGYHKTSQVCIYVVGLATLLFQGSLSPWYTFTRADRICSYAKWTPGNPVTTCNGSTSCSSSTVAGLVFFETFSYIWTSLVVSSVSLTTLAGGPFGCAASPGWYYFGPREVGLMPKHPTLGSFWRASTLSLGSIAFGSLIVTVLEIIRLLLSLARSSADAKGNPVGACLACCAECIIGCVESMPTMLALYGKPYLRAAKDTWNLFKDRGVDALVSMALMWGAYAVGMVHTHLSYNDHGQYTAPVVLFSFIIGAQLPRSHALSIKPADPFSCQSRSVGLGEDLGVLAIRAPEVFGPHVVQGVSRV
ncbi:plasma-membrane choline transporter-domain-containing protein [Russula compacta]|nr:plasma-membrane choline transporter-domain-containing protein [Russula compacta]